jgi:hypothetical protein
MDTGRFDQAAATWDEAPRRAELAQAVAGVIARQVPLWGCKPESSNMGIFQHSCIQGQMPLNVNLHGLSRAWSNPSLKIRIWLIELKKTYFIVL